MAANALVPLAYYLQNSLRNVDLRSFANGFDLQQFVSNIDFKTVGWIAVAVVAVIFVLELFSKPVGPFGRSLAVSAADAWTSRDQYGLGNVGRGSRSLEPLTEVLDSLAEAVKKWETPEENAIRNRAF